MDNNTDNQFNQGNMQQNNFDPTTGQPIQENQFNQPNMQQNMQPNNFNPATGQPIQENQFNQPNMQQNMQYQQAPNYNVPPQKKNKTLKTILIIFGAIIIVGIVAVILIVAGVFSFSKKLVCTSNEGNITIYYTDKQLTGYAASNITYDLTGQKEIANQIGVDSYLNQFEIWFQTNTTGTCERK